MNQSGEGGNLRYRIFVNDTVAWFRSQHPLWQLVTVFWLVVVVCGYLGFPGIGISTVSAQSEYLGAAVVPGLVPGGRAARRRQRQRDRAGAGDDNANIAASYSRFSSAQQRDESITQQQSEARKNAESNGHDLRVDLEFSDEAVSGTKRNRLGLNELLRAAEAGEFKVLYFYSVSRLARESVITMPILKRLVHTHGIRVVSVTEGIDSAAGGWEVLATILSLVSERFLKELAASVFRGQQGAVEDGFSVGDYCFGYSSEPVEGTQSSRRGRNAKPRMRYVIDPTEAAWVQKIFHWFVVERQSITWMVKQLNAQNAPKDHRASTPDWRHNLVTELLSRLKYVGIWTWGQSRNVRDPETGDVRQEPRTEEETERWIRQLPELQIVELETFVKAQELLDENEQKFGHRRNEGGKFQGSLRDREAGHPLHLLSGLIKCGECGANFVVGGAHGAYMFCPACKRGTCSCKTQLNRELAERLLLDAIGRQIVDSAVWTRAVIDAAMKAWHDRDDRVPAQLAAIRQQIAEVERRRSRLLDRIETGNADPDVSRRLESRRLELQKLRQQEASLLQQQNVGAEPPTEAWLREQLAELGTVLHESTPAAAYALRDLVGGVITVHEVRRKGRKRHFLKATFALQTSSLADSLGMPLTADVKDSQSPADQIEIDIVDPAAGSRAAEARRLYELDLPNKEIAVRMGLSRGRVTALLKQSFADSGEEMPSGYRRRAALKRQNEAPPQFMQIADEVMALREEGWLHGDIAELKECSRDLITQAIRFWHESKGLEVPDGRSFESIQKRKSQSGQS